MTNKPGITAAIIICATLAACGGPAADRAPATAGIAAAVTPAVLTADQVGWLSTKCQEYGPVLAVGAAPAMPAVVKETAVYPKAYCDRLLAGQVPPTTDANTPTWFSKTLSGLATAAKIAGVVLPLIL